MKHRQLLFWILIGLGLILSGYLLYRGLSLMANSVPGTIDLCSVVLGTGCDESLLSDSSMFLGIPLAGWGIVYYLTLSVLLVLGKVMREDIELEAAAGALIIAVLGACGSVYLLVNIIADWIPFCPLCLVIHTINLLLVPVIWRMSGRSTKQLTHAFLSGVKYVISGKSESPKKARWTVVGFVMVALFALVLYQWVLVEVKLHQGYGSAAFDPDTVLYEYSSVIPQDLPISPDDPLLGSTDMRVNLVVFSSFECPGCREFVSIIHQLVSSYPDKLTVIFKPFPLDPACNPLLSGETDSLACQAAWAAFAAHQQGQFWPYHDALFAANLNEEENIFIRIAQDLGLDLERFDRDRFSPTTTAKVSEDIELGIRLNVDSTPAVFLNGRRVKNLSLQSLKILIEKEIDRSYFSNWTVTVPFEEIV